MCKICDGLKELNENYDSKFIVESAKKIIKYFYKYKQSNLGEIVDGIFLFENLVSILKHAITGDYDKIMSYIREKFYNIATNENSIAEHIVKYFVCDSYVDAMKKYHFLPRESMFDSNENYFYYYDKKIICSPTFIGYNVHDIIKSLKKTDIVYKLDLHNELKSIGIQKYEERDINRKIMNDYTKYINYNERNYIFVRVKSLNDYVVDPGQEIVHRAFDKFAFIIKDQYVKDKMKKSENEERSEKLYNEITRITKKYYGLKIFIYDDSDECHSLVTHDPIVKTYSNDMKDECKYSDHNNDNSLSYMIDFIIFIIVFIILLFVIIYFMSCIE